MKRKLSACCPYDKCGLRGAAQPLLWPLFPGLVPSLVCYLESLCCAWEYCNEGNCNWGILTGHMEEKPQQKFSWTPGRSREKDGHRPHCCHVPRQSENHKYRDRSGFRHLVRILHEFLEDGFGRAPDFSCAQEWDFSHAPDFGHTPEAPRTCPCCDASMHDSSTVARFLRSVSPFLMERCDRYMSGLSGDLGFPFQLLHSLFLKLESAQRWHRLVVAVPYLRDLQEIFSHIWTQRPREMCLSCRGCREAESEAGRPQRKGHFPDHSLSRTMPKYPSTRPLMSEFCRRRSQTDGDLSNKEPQAEPEEGHFTSIQKQETALKLDVEKQQLCLTHIESRLSSLEQRAESVTHRLQEANLELEAIKRGSVAVRTLVDQQDCLWEDATWRDALQAQRTHWEPVQQPEESGGTEDAGSQSDWYRPMQGSRDRERRAKAGIFQCQEQINALLQQIAQEITQTEADLGVAISAAYRG
ncbi:uncharacterized protein [Hyperolius riggenbachi]|uniref:uncharacterized protein isoform X2 n=1 Tax=Hyperolius riggenbachi TaxID=752182 RepID=UPI0035A32FC9